MLNTRASLPNGERVRHQNHERNNHEDSSKQRRHQHHTGGGRRQIKTLYPLSAHRRRSFAARWTCIFRNQFACSCVLQTTPALCICISRGTHSASIRCRPADDDHLLIAGLVFLETSLRVFVSCQQHQHSVFASPGNANCDHTLSAHRRRPSVFARWTCF